MASVRRRLRAFATTWLVLQLAWLTALVPRDCCAAHQPVADAGQGGQRTGAAHCPMRSPDGRPCPMHGGSAGHGDHQGSAGEHHHQDAPAPARCALRGTCNGPAAAFLSFQFSHAILPDSPAALPDLQFDSFDSVHQDLVARFQPPDPPPPRF